MSETCLKQFGDESKISEMAPNGYKFLHSPRLTYAGSGLAVIFKDCLIINNTAIVNNYDTMETMQLLVTHRNK